jgi:hypothetical protein
MQPTNVRKKTFTPRDDARAQAAKWVAKKHGCTIQYIYAMLRGDREEVENLLFDYNKKYAELQKVLAL